jgi:very-short-patch-repair endonuclease
MKPANPSNNYHYNKALKKYARVNRANMTKGEACMWKYVLRNRQLAGYQFRRQRPILNYIVDFICFDLMLVIEVDGYSHEFRKKEINDRVRDEDLESIGFTVFRFTDSEILQMLPDVVERLSKWIIEN